MEVKSSRTIALGGRRYRLEVFGFPVQMREDGGQWVNIDPARGILPYELTLDGKKATIRDKVSGKVGTIELINVKPKGLKFEVIPLNNEVCFRHALPSDKVPFEAQFKVEGFPFRASAFDDEGELELKASFIEGILTEKLTEVRDKKIRQTRNAKGNIRIDPTLTVQPPAKDANIDSKHPDTPFGTDTWAEVGCYLGDPERAIVEFDISELPSGATLNSATLSLYKCGEDSNPEGRIYWAYKLTRTDWVESEATWNVYKSGLSWGTAGGEYVTSAPSGDSSVVPFGNAWMHWDVLAIVQDAYNNSKPAEFLVRDADETVFRVYTEFTTKEATGDNVPKLVVEYTTGWTGKISGVTNPAKIMGVDVANIAKVKRVA